jgi:small subunit ribosomal protein S1
MAVEAELKTQSSSIKEFESLLNEDFKDRKLKENEIIKATVTEITKNFIVVDCKAKMEGMIPIEEFKNDNELENLKTGSVIEVYLERIESFKGEIVISRDKARKMNAWKKMEKYFQTQEELVGIITGRVKGGYICEIDGLPTFMPASQIDVRPLKKIDHLMNVPVKVIATRIDKQRGNVCTSRRQVLEKSKNAEILEALKNLKEGDIVVSKVKSCTDWGIFVDINGCDALVHVSDLSYGRVKKPSDLVTSGQDLKVRITKIDKKTNRVSASVKALSEDPYENLAKNYKVGKIYTGTVTKLMEYGAFIKLELGVEGLIHNSELSWKNRNVQPNKILSVSQEIQVKIVSIDTEAKRISLSYKETLENPWKIIKDKVGEITEVKIKNITDKAIFAELDSGLTGMIHYKEISFNENEEDLKKIQKKSNN